MLAHQAIMDWEQLVKVTLEQAVMDHISLAAAAVQVGLVILDPLMDQHQGA